MWAELEAEKSKARAQEAADAAAAAIARIEADLLVTGPFTPAEPAPEGEEAEAAVDIIAARMQDYYDGQLVVVQKELEQMEADEREEYLARDAMKAVDVYHKAIADSMQRRRELTGEEEASFMAAEDVLAQQARIVEKAFEGVQHAAACTPCLCQCHAERIGYHVLVCLDHALFSGMRRLEDLEATIEEEYLEEDYDPSVPGLDQEVVGIVDQLVQDRLEIIDQGGETPEQRHSKEVAAEEAKWKHVEEFLASRVSEEPGSSPAGNADESEIEAEALQSQQELDALFQEMNSMFDATPGSKPRYKEKYDYKYKYNMFEVAGSRQR